MGHEALAVVQPVRLGHGEVHVEEFVLVVEVGVHDSLLAVGFLTNVTTEPNTFAGFELLDGHFPEFVHVHVEVPHFPAANHVTEHFNRVHVVVRLVLGWPVNDGNVVAQVPADVLVKELLWRQVGVAVEVIILVAVFEVKRCRWFAEAVCQHPVNFR